MASRNPFALLSDDNDASDNEQQTLPKVTKPVTVDAAPKNGKPTRAPIPGATTRRNVPGQTTVRPQKEANELPASDAPAGEKAQFEGERGRDTRGTNFGRGRGAARGGRGGERGAPRGDRTEGGGRGGGRGGRAPRTERPDRHSQTDRTDSNKAEHQGWGGDDGKRELENENAGVTDAAAEKTSDGTDGAAAENAVATPATAETAKAAEAPVEPEDNSKTYDEYVKEQKAAGRGVLDGLSVERRKANEGADDSQWKDGVALTKNETDEGYFADLQKEKASKARKERKEKTFLEVEFQAPARASSGGDRPTRGGRGGRGRGEGAPRGRGAGGRGGRGRGGAPSSQSNGSVNLSDNNAFPSLA